MVLIFALALNAFSAHAETKAIKEAASSIRLLIAPLIPGQRNIKDGPLKNFRVDQCETQKINWTDVLLMRNLVTLEYKFKEGCDLQGRIVPKIFSPFPAQFKLRNLKHYDEVKSENKVGTTFESNPIMNIEMRQGQLTGSGGKVKFEADYRVQIDPLNKERPVKKNLGGEIRITEIDGKKVNIREKIMIE